jgi:tRNA threonylcarbamoyladenosine biosynthesis protein TsaB
LAIVGFDTATDDTAVCALRGGEVLHEATVGAKEGERPLHATALLPELERAAGAAGGWTAVDRLAVGLGPGSFTGLRIAIATAKALRAGLGLPAVGVGTLDAVGAALGEWGGRGRERLAVLDARRGEVFYALYDGDGAALWPPAVEQPAALRARLDRRSGAALAAGSGAVRFRQELVGGGLEIPDDSDPVHRVSARHLCELAAGVAATEVGRLDPIYLRPPDAARWRERDTRKRTGT